MHLGFSNEDTDLATRRETEKNEYRMSLLKQMEINKQNKEKIKEKQLEEDLKEELRFYKSQSIFSN